MDVYKIGKDYVILNLEGNSYVSYVDYVIVVIDEIEWGEYINECFIVVFDVR